jgi:hypothetical protein
MAHSTKRIQTVLTEAQFKTLGRLASAHGKTISALVREAVEEVYFKDASLQRRREALASLFDLNAPVADWDRMEDEIECECD